MKITPIITHLRTRCPSFSGRVAGALELSALLEENAPLMALPAAYVVPTRDDPESVTTHAPYQQALLEQFDVVLALPTSDERGQAVADRLHDLRSELWRALLGWRPSDLYEPIEYDGGDMLLLNRARVLYRYAFRLESQIGGVRSAGAPPETWHDVAQDDLPVLSGMRAGVDYAVPDGRIEHQLDVKFPTNP